MYYCPCGCGQVCEDNPLLAVVGTAMPGVAMWPGFLNPACYYCGSLAPEGSDVCPTCWAGLADNNPRPRRARRSTRRNPRDQGFVGEITAAQARKLAKASGQLEEFEAALGHVQEFNGARARRFRVYRYDDGKAEVTREFASALGRVPESRYLGQPRSPKKNAEDGGPVEWHHKHPRGSEPLEVKFAATGLTGKVGGSLKVKDWMYD